MSDEAEAPPPNPIARNRSGIIGRPVDRYEGPLKVSGVAPYAYEARTPAPPAYGVLVGARIGCGRVVAVDDRAARAAPGVLLVWHPFAPPPGIAPSGGKSYVQSTKPSAPVLATPDVVYFGQPMACVVAHTLETATAAAALLEITYEEGEAAYRFDPALAKPTRADSDSLIGDFEGAFAAAPLQVDRAYSTPIHNHCSMEPCATTAWWEGDKAVVHTSTQMVNRPRQAVADALQIPPEQIQVLSRYVGGGFGAKGSVYEDVVAATLAARELGRPVKVAFTRQQMFNATTSRPATAQRVRLGATRDGRLTALALESASHAGRRDPFLERAAAFARALYAAPNRLTSHRIQLLDVAVASAARAPGEAVGMLSLECAMDELAEQLGLDPIELRIRNEPERHPETGKPYSARQLVECMREGARRFGWNERDPTPGRRRDGPWQVGMGMAAAIRGNFLLPARAAVRAEADGTIRLRQGMTDIGTGSYTILAQIVAETMGVPLERVVVEIGDSGFAPAPGSGGQFGAASAGSGAFAGGMALRGRLAELAVADAASPLYGARTETVDFRDGLIAAENRSETLAGLVSRLSPEGIEAEGASAPSPQAAGFASFSHGAQFAEVGVDPVTGEVRMRRMLGVFACGRILNQKTARSQITGGMIWGVGAALTESNRIDPRYGSLTSQDLGGYLAPVQADIGEIDAIFLPEVDETANPLGIKGVGEAGICGAGAAIANAVYNACGARVRDYPLTPDRVLAATGAL